MKCILCIEDRREFAVYCDLKAHVDVEGLLACRGSVSWSLSTSLTPPPHPSPQPLLAHSALILGCARNVHTYRPKHAVV